jgi:hypothetical protein
MIRGAAPPHKKEFFFAGKEGSPPRVLPRFRRCCLYRHEPSADFSIRTAIRHSKMPRKVGRSSFSVLKREEFFFGNVPSAKIESCFYYEYARINRSITDCVMRWRKKIGKDLEGAKTASLKSSARDTFGAAFRTALQELAPLVGRYYFVETAVFLLSRRCFPDTPWQLLARADKAAWEKALNLYRDFEKGKGGVWHIELFRSNLEDFYRAQFGPIPEGAIVTYAAFQCDWRGGVEKVNADFKRWARKQWDQLKHKKRPRALYHEWRKQLAVMRLHQKLRDWEQVQAALREHGIYYGRPDMKGDTRAC